MFPHFLSYRGTFTSDPEPSSSAGWVCDGWSSISPGGGSDCGCGGVSEVSWRSVHTVRHMIWFIYFFYQIHIFCLLLFDSKRRESPYSDRLQRYISNRGEYLCCSLSVIWLKFNLVKLTIQFLTEKLKMLCAKGQHIIGKVHNWDLWQTKSCYHLFHFVEFVYRCEVFFFSLETKALLGFHRGTWIKFHSPFVINSYLLFVIQCCICISVISLCFAFRDHSRPILMIMNVLSKRMKIRT